MPPAGMLLKEDELRKLHASLEPIHRRVLEDVRWHLDSYFNAMEEGTDPAAQEAAKIFHHSKLTSRVKPFDTLWRKCRRDEITEAAAVHDRIEDLLGLRIATANKDQARTLFDFFRAKKDVWFCPTAAQPNFVLYTIADRNKYSLDTGYQAYHITFSYDKAYHPVTAIAKWPIEIQVMSQLWDFWANYSREYFYGASDAAARFLPYNVTISKILDAADDLMVATTDILLKAGREEPVPEQAGPKPPGVTVDEVRTWFQKNVNRYFGPKARVPIDLFLAKVTEELNLYGVSLARLEEILQNKDNAAVYERLLEASGISYLPPYQHILCRILISLGWNDKQVTGRVNEELWLQGLALVPPAPVKPAK